MADTLLRETQPPVGQIASPVPQYWNPEANAGAGGYEKVQGKHGAHRVILYDANGNPLLTDTNPAKVQLIGRNVQPVFRTITTTPLGAGGLLIDSWTDLSASPGILAVGLMVYADTVTVVDVEGEDGTSSTGGGSLLYVAVKPLNSGGSGPGPVFLPPFRPLGRRFRFVLRNPTQNAQTVLRAVAVEYRDIAVQPQNLRCWMADQLAIRDTATHDHNTDPQYAWKLVRTWYGGGKLPVYIRNFHNQPIDVTVSVAMPGIDSFALGTKTVPAGAKVVITNADFPGIDVPSEQISLSYKASVAPTSGNISTWVDLLCGSTA